VREIVTIDARDILPDPCRVLSAQGVVGPKPPSDRVIALLDDALQLLEANAAPKGLFEEVTRESFDAIYKGQGRNALETPVDEITPRSDNLALFAATIGEAVSATITRLFDERDFALGAMLDAAASEATENAGDIIQYHVFERLREREDADSETKLLRYSPGYCGWHISGQEALFATLRPGEIGITLRRSFLMEPLKSMSGVIVAGPGRIHEFEDTYDFCSDCRARGCRERIDSVLRG